MSDTDPLKGRLPVTAELGDEGGSYGDATHQVDTFKGAPGNTRIDPKQVSPTGQIAEEVVPSVDPEDVVRDPSEPPRAPES